jgi:cyclophilin family peptidyl-prolyl cis-trans isomerase
MTAFKFSAAQRNAYTTVGGAPHLDGAYTVFGEVISGMEYVDSIAKQQVDGNARPFKDIKMNITLINE